MKPVKKRIFVFILVFALVIEAISGIYGGLTLVLDPSGGLLQMPVSLLNRSLFTNFLIPGLILLVLIGLFPIILIYSLLVKPAWHFMDTLNIHRSNYWAWTYTLYNSIILVSWINIQLMILNQGAAIHGIVGFWVTIILILTLTPGVKQSFRIPLGI
jgi:hypothetical protein